MQQNDPHACVPLRRRFLDVCVHEVTMAQAMACMEGFIEEGGPHHVVTLDASMCVGARHDAELRRIVCEADLVTPDSAGILWAARRFGVRLVERVSGVEIVAELAARSPTTGASLFLLGAAPGVAEEAARKLQDAYPGCRIVGARHGYFGPDEEAQVLGEVRASGADVLCVAMGIPKQEKWIARNREVLRIPVMIGVGGTLDVLSGRLRRAPHWMRRTNLEWLYRVMTNPRKIGKVMMLPRFVAMVMSHRAESGSQARVQ